MADAPVAVELIADGGRAARSDDLFRSAPFLAAEGVTHTLRLSRDGWSAALPLIVREVPGGAAVDAISPYGYPGATTAGDGTPPDPAEVDWGRTGLVSVFVRERLGGAPCLAGGRRRSEVQVHDPARPRAMRSRLAEQIRQNERLGYGVEVLAGPDAGAEARGAFHRMYTQTMERAGAGERYFFTTEYLERVLEFGGSRLLLARAGDGAPAAGAIAGRSDGMLHYFLGGTADGFLDDSPFKNVVAAMLDLADADGRRLNLGGGLAPGDGLERFKRGFANATAVFVTHEVVCDAGAYARLAAGRPDDAEFFPLYRSPTG